MKPAVLIPIVLLTSAVAGGVAATVAPRPEAAPPAGDAEELARLADAVERLAARQDASDRALRELRATPALAPVGDARVALSDIEAAVERYMQGRALPAPAAAGGDDEAPAASREERLAEALALLEGDLDDTERQRLWRRLAEEGLTDDVVAAYEARAEANPNDPDLQVELGGVYLNKIFEVGNSPEAGHWATKADAAFDRALEIDDRHWDARFSKAVSLSFWPPVFGKQGEAIRHFEVLVGQQQGLAADPRHAQTHLLLGNMYQQIGENEKALAAWRGGLELFPDDEDLAGQIEVFGGQ